MPKIELVNHPNIEVYSEGVRGILVVGGQSGLRTKLCENEIKQLITALQRVESEVKAEHIKTLVEVKGELT